MRSASALASDRPRTPTPRCASQIYALSSTACRCPRQSVRLPPRWWSPVTVAADSRTGVTLSARQPQTHAQGCWQGRICIVQLCRSPLALRFDSGCTTAYCRHWGDSCTFSTDCSSAIIVVRGLLSNCGVTPCAGRHQARSTAGRKNPVRLCPLRSCVRLLLPFALLR